MLNGSPELRTSIQQGLYNRTLTFNPDGSFVQNDGFGNQITGTWGIQGQTLTISNPVGGQWVQQISQLTANTLALRQAPKGDAQPIVPVLYLTKM